MKCFVCGYSYNGKNPNEYEIETKTGNGCIMKTVYKNGGKPFIEICGLSGEVRRSGNLIIRNVIPIYACPNCGTIRVGV